MQHTGRLLTLDAMRGFAVMGILLMNIIAFSMPDMAYINPSVWGGGSTASELVWAANFVLVDGKMRGLFSLLFGASTLIIWKGATARGEGTETLLRRFFWLFVLGLAHYVFLWWGDILRLYAVVGPLLLLFVHRKPEELLRVAVLAFLLQFLLLAALAISMTLAGEAAMPSGTGEALRQEITLHQGSYWGIVEDRISNMGNDQFVLLALSGFEALGFMLLGMAMLKSGFLAGAWPIARYLRLAARCYAAGGLPMLALALWCRESGFDQLVTFNAVISWSFPFRILLTLAHGALFMALLKRLGSAGLILRIAAAGRTAFTNYIGTSMVMTTIFYGYGLGQYGQLDRAEVYALVLPAWALMLTWPLPWLRRFRYGPFEWAWRSLTLMQPQPMRRA